MWSPSQQNGWWPRFSPDGLKLAYGNATSFVADFRADGAPVESLLLSGGYAGYWLTNHTLMVTQVTAANGWWNRFLYSVPTLPTSPWVSTPQTAVFANWFDAADGHWASNVANGPVTYDGTQVLDRGHGVSIAGGLLATMQDEEILIRAPSGTWALAGVKEPPHTFKINAQGYLTYGRGTIWVRTPDGQHVSAMATPWMQEYEGVTVMVGNVPWVWTGTTDPSNGVSMLIGRPLGEKDVIVVHGVNYAAISVVYQPGLQQFVVAGCNTNGWLLQRAVPVDAPRVRLVPTMAPFPRKLLFGSFYAFSSRYGSAPEYPQNATVAVTEKRSDGTLYPFDHVKEAAAKVPIITDSGPEMLSYIKAQNLQQRVLALFIGDTNGWQNAEQQAKDAKTRWRSLFGDVRPVLWYITPGEPNQPGFQIPPSVDILGPEFYFPDVPSARLEELRWRLLGWWLDKLGSSIKPWILICQAFDRANPNFSGPDALTSLQPKYLTQLVTVDPRIGQLPPAIGVLLFAAKRPGGSLTYPDWAAWHKAMHQSLPPGLPELPAGGAMLPPKITITQPSTWPQSGVEPFRLRCVAAPEPGSGQVDTYVWLYRPVGSSTWLVAAQNPSWDEDHTYVCKAGEWEIALQGKGPGGTAQTGRQRIVRVTVSGGGGGGGGEPQPSGKSAIKTFHGAFWTVQANNVVGTSTTDQKFEIYSVGPGLVALKAENGKYVCAEGGGSAQILVANRTAVGIWETFKKEPVSGGFALKADNGQYVCAEGDGRMTVSRDAAGPWETFQLAGAAGGGALQPLQVDAKYFRQADGTRFHAIECSDFSLYKRYLDGEDITGVLAQRASLGFNMLRVWLLNTSVIPGGLQPKDYANFYARLRPFLQLCEGFGLYVELTAFTQTKTLMPDVGDQFNHWEQTVSAVQGAPNVLLELVNEADQHDNATSANFQRAAGILCSTGSNGADSAPPMPVWDYCLYHTNDLNEFQRKVGHNAMEWADHHNVPCMSNENTRFSDKDNDPDHAYDAAAGAALLCAGACYHSQAGKLSELWDGDQLARAQDWVAGATSVPLEYQPGAYRRHDELNGPDVIRAYSRTLSDGRSWLVKIRP